MLYNKKSDLTSFIDAVKGNDFLRVEEDLGNGYVKLKVTEAEKRQARHDIKNLEDAVVELLRNSRDAGATKIYVASHRTQERHIISIIDDGSGVPRDLKDRIFEPRVTSKLNTIVEDKYGIHGRGMALFAIRSAAASFELINSVAGAGSNFRIISDPLKLPEKKDQSTFPEARLSNGKISSLAGIRNIPRVVSEFVLDNDIRVYFGSQTEILNLLVFHSDMWRSHLNLDLDVEKHDDLLKIASLFGFQISGRNIYRLINGQIRTDLLVQKKIIFKGIDSTTASDIFPGLGSEEEENKVVSASKFRNKKRYKGAALSARFTDDDLRFSTEKLTELMSAISTDHFINIKDIKAIRSGDKIKIVIDLEDEH